MINGLSDGIHPLLSPFCRIILNIFTLLQINMFNHLESRINEGGNLIFGLDGGHH